ncbi:hypothetical protein [Dyella nitratireducens]|uniref:Uncharacterized protein n=1 Tax=Dyella nitratireducens TaxID=1849580 RepID=A0ABQ1GJ07_9GAMM|nr:hypothetical protein [Dyella nitratireducens]GGA44608.1 hypothetical protein GCM10010981_37230 [Dyella nitratireducens]GLQ41720.1 hypothetical protein GCM10007902_15700 [Dyella nitratireducens]
MDTTKASQPTTTAARTPALAAASAGVSAPSTNNAATVIQLVPQPGGDGLFQWTNTGMLALYGVLFTLGVKWISDVIQRRYELRRQLYLDLVDAAQSQTACLGRMCDVDIPMKETQKQFQDTASAIARVELIAPQKMSRLLSEFKISSGRAMIKLMEMRAPIEKLRVDLLTADQDIAMFARERGVFIDELRRMTIEGNEDAARLARLNQHCEYYSAEIQKRHERKKAFAADAYTLTNKMATAATEYLAMLAKQMPALLKYARKELGYRRFDLSEYQKRTDETADMMKNVVADLQESVRKTVKPDEDKKT